MIGLMGYAQTGKDTVADILVRDHGFVRLAFADVLRDCLYALNPCVVLESDHGVSWRYGDVIPVTTLVDVYGWEAAKQEPDVRRLLQRLGTEAGRNILGPDIWADALMRQVDDLKYAYVDNVAITDVRFPNEADAIQDRHGLLWRIERYGKGPVNDHESETALDDRRADLTLINDYDVGHLDCLVRARLCDSRDLLDSRMKISSVIYESDADFLARLQRVADADTLAW